MSLMPLLKGGNELDRVAIYWLYPHYGNQGGEPGASMRMGDYKLIKFLEGIRIELYNLREDIGEDRDLAAAKKGSSRPTALHGVNDVLAFESQA